MRTFRALRRWLLPGFLGGQKTVDSADDADEGARVAYSLGVVLDVFAERLLQGLRLRFPEEAHPSALPYLGRDRRLVRGINEPAASYAARLVAAPDAHLTQGNPFALLKQIAAYLQSDCMLGFVDDSGNWFRYNVWSAMDNATIPGSTEYLLAQDNWDWDGLNATTWSRFWVIIYAWSTDPPIAERDGTWDDGETWGAKPDSTWGCTFTDEQVTSIRAIIKEWKPAGTRCVNTIVSFDDAATDFEPMNTISDPGTWGQRSRNVAGTQVRTRNPGAIYMRGTAP
jgi:hypothetical protein